VGVSGGKVEPHESVQQCIVRELAEELSVRASAGEVLAETTYTYDGGEMHLIAVEVSLLDSLLRLSVHDEFQWVVPARLLGLELAPADISIAEEIIRRHG
jgi:8-oxo-dGTP diphosphatase